MKSINNMPLPEILNTRFKVDEPKLWAVDLPIEEIPMAEIENNLDIAYLEKKGTDDWNLTPRMLIDNFDQEPTHAKRVEETDLKYPIDIYFHQGQWIILDGVHRFTKAVRLGHKTIRARKVSDQVAEQTKRMTPPMAGSVQ